MAVSGSKNYTITGTDIVNSALRKTGDYDIGEPVNGDETAAALTALNLMVKAWVARGVGLWLRDEVTLFLQKDIQSYTMGTSGTAESTTSYVETTLSAAEASGQTVISVTDSTGMTASDRVGIKMDDNSIHWTTIVSVDSSTQITITTATDDDAASGNKVYAYTTKADRPQRIKYAFRRDTSDIDTEIRVVGQNEYYRLSNKGSAGPTTEVWYDPRLTTGKIFVWPVDGGSTVDKVVLLADMLPDDFDVVANNPEFPIEWGEALVYNLADRLAPEYGMPRLERRELKIEAREMLEAMLDYDVEHASVIFGMK